MTGRARGHRTLPHTADVILQVWAPDEAACCEEAVAALVETYVDPSTAEAVATRALHLAPDATESVVVELLDEVIFLLDTSEAVPVGARVRPAGDGGFDVELVLADAASVEPTGAVPKAISRSELRVEHGPDGVRCSFLVDL